MAPFVNCRLAISPAIFSCYSIAFSRTGDPNGIWFFRLDNRSGGLAACGIKCPFRITRLRRWLQRCLFQHRYVPHQYSYWRWHSYSLINRSWHWHPPRIAKSNGLSVPSASLIFWPRIHPPALRFNQKHATSLKAGSKRYAIFIHLTHFALGWLPVKHYQICVDRRS